MWKNDSMSEQSWLSWPYTEDGHIPCCLTIKKLGLQKGVFTVLQFDFHYKECTIERFQ